MNDYSFNTSTEDYPSNTYLEKNYYILNQSYIRLQRDYESLLEEKNELDKFYQLEIKKYMRIIKDLKNQNEIINQKLIDQSNLYKSLLLDFSSQQLLIENKTIKVTSLIEKTNQLLEELTNLKEINSTLEEEMFKMQNKQINNEDVKLKNKRENFVIDKMFITKEKRKIKNSRNSLNQEISYKGDYKYKTCFDKENIENKSKIDEYTILRMKHKTLGKLNNLSKKHQTHKSMIENYKWTYPNY